jgi:hypothetical protein
MEISPITTYVQPEFRSSITYCGHRRAIGQPGPTPAPILQRSMAALALLL